MNNPKVKTILAADITTLADQHAAATREGDLACAIEAMETAVLLVDIVHGADRARPTERQTSFASRLLQKAEALEPLLAALYQSYMKDSRHVNAEELLLTQISRLERAAGVDDERLAPWYSRFGEFALAPGKASRAPRAIPLMKRAMAMNSTRYGPVSRQVALSASTLGALLNLEGDFEQAEKTLQFARLTLAACLGTDRPEVAIADVRFAVAVAGSGNHQAAVKLLNAARDTIIASLGCDNVYLDEANDAMRTAAPRCRQAHLTPARPKNDTARAIASVSVRHCPRYRLPIGTTPPQT